MSNNAPFPIDYTSRDYASLRDDLVQLIRTRTGINWQADDPSDIGVALLEAFAYMGDIVNYYIDRAANESFIDTATQRQTLLNLANLYGYRPSGPTPSSASITFTNRGVNAIDIPVGTQVIAPLQYGDYSEVFFETTESATALAAGSSVTLKATEGKTANTDRPDLIDPATNTPLPVSLGASSGLPNQTFYVPDSGVVDGTVRAYVGQGVAFTEWAWADSLVEWGPYNQVFTTQVNSDGSTSIVFGDGVNGAIPSASQLISSSYRVSSGAAGNVTAGQIVEVSFIPGNIDPNSIASLGVTNATSAVGGADADDNTQIRTKLKRSISARRRAVTLLDYEALCLLVPMVGRAKAVAGTATSVTLYVQPQNDGTISPGVDPGTNLPTTTMLSIETAVAAYFADKMPVNTSLTVLPPVYADLDVAVTATVSPAYRQRDVNQAITASLLDQNAGRFCYYSYNFGALVSLSDIIMAVASIPGVLSVTVGNLSRHGVAGATNVQMLDYELPRLLATNLTISLNGGLV